MATVLESGSHRETCRTRCKVCGNSWIRGLFTGFIPVAIFSLAVVVFHWTAVALLSGGLHLAWGYAGEPNVTFDVWKSTDQKYWTMVGTTTAETFGIPPNPNRHRPIYYKVKTRSLINGLVSTDSNIVSVK